MESGSKAKDTGRLKSEPLVSKKSYRRLLTLSVLTVSLVAIIPVVFMTAVNYFQYQDAFHVESLRPISRFTTNTKLSLEAFLSQRVSALSLVSQIESLENLQDSKNLNRLLGQMKRSFNGFIDLGLIDHTGKQVSYSGPYDLEGKNYQEHAWFHEVESRGVHVSEVFLGHRRLPHFVIAVSFDTPTATNYVLRATIDTELIVKQIQSLSTHSYGDAFLVNKEGVLQTPSRFYGKVLEPCPLPVPPMSTYAEVFEAHDEHGIPIIIGYASIDRSPFILMLLQRPGSLQTSWISLRRELVLFLAISVILILAAAFFGSRYMVNRARQSDIRRTAVFHKMEYTNKLAAIGRLASGVAHEINNPLANINQKAGLHKDLLTFSDDLPSREKMTSLVDSVLESVERAGAITHWLLGFAKHMDVQNQEIDLEVLIRGVLGFLEKEASYRNLNISLDFSADVPTIFSDHGQLQQVFLNIINNAFAAVGDGGLIHIAIVMAGAQKVEISIEDDGVGIPDEDLEHIFEPFFTTKKENGTGLGLSITYGIVQKLGGQTEVTSKLGEGTRFTVLLPVERD